MLKVIRGELNAGRICRTNDYLFTTMMKQEKSIYRIRDLRDRKACFMICAPNT